MGALGQLGLILWKSIILRKRQPFILFIEILWPVVIFLVVVLVRRTTPPEEKAQCYFAPRALPSAGFPFLQSFVCNLDNKCYPNESMAILPKDVGLSSFMNGIQPMLSEPEKTKSFLNDLPKASAVFSELTGILDSPEIKRLLDVGLVVENFLQDPDKVRRFLVEDLKVLSPDIVDTILRSSLNISKIFDLSGHINFKQIVCNSEELSQYLIFNGDADVALIAKQLCSISANNIPNIVDFIQWQLDIAKILNMAATLKEATGEKKDAQMLHNVARLVDLLLNSKSIKGLMGGMTDVNSITKWINNIVNYAQKFEDGSFEDIIRLQALLLEMEPILSSYLGGEQWYQDAKKSVAQLLTVTDWLNSGAKSMYEIPLQLTGLLYDKPELSQWMMSLNLTQEIIEEVMAAKINNEQLFLVVEMIWKGKDVKTVLCDSPGFSSLFYHRDQMAKTRLDQVQAALCKHDYDKWNQQLTSLTDMESLLNTLNNVSTGPLDLKGVNWTEIYKSGKDLVNGFSVIFDSMGPVLNEFNAEELWNNVAKFANGLVYMDDWQASAQQFQPLLDIVQQLLEGSEPWEGKLKTIIVAQDLSLEITTILYNRLQDFAPYMARLLREDANFQTLAQQIVDSDQDTITAIIKSLSNQTNIEFLVSNVNDLDRLLCDLRRLNDILNQDGHSKFDLSVAEGILCSRNTSHLLKKIISDIDLAEVEKLSADLRSLIEGTISPDDPKFRSRQNISAIFSKTLVLVQLMINFNQSSVNWNSITDELQKYQSISINGTKWGIIYEELMDSFAMAYVGKLVEVYGEMLEQTNIWPEVLPVFKEMDGILVSMIMSAKTSTMLYSNKTVSGQILYYMLKFAPELMTALADTLTNEDKMRQLSSVSDYKSLLCDPDELATILTVPNNVPLSDIQTLLCNLDIDKLVKEWTDPAIINSAVKNISLPGGNDATDFDWVIFYTHIEEFAEVITSQVDGTQSAWKYVQQFDWNAMSDAGSNLGKVIMNMPPSSLSVVAVMQAEVMKSMDAWFNNTPSWQMVRYYSYSLNELMKAMNNMMEGVADGLTLDSMFLNSSVAYTLLKTQLQLTPDLMDALSQAIIKPDQMMKMLLTTDMSQNTLCNGLELNDVLTFKNPAKIKEYEKMLCQLDTQALMEDIMKHPMMQEIVKAMDRLVAYNVSKIPVNFEVDWTGLSTNMGKMIELLTTMGYNPSYPVFPDVPEFNMTEVQNMGKKMWEQMKSIDLASMNQLLTQMDGLTAWLTNLTSGDAVAKQIMDMTLQYLYFTNEHFNMVNGLLRKMNGTQVIKITDLIESPELDKLLASIQSVPDVFKVLMNGIMNLMINPNKAADFAKLGDINEVLKLCTDLNAFTELFPQPKDSSVDMAATQKRICEAAGVNMTVLMQELLTGIEGLDKYLDLFNKLKMGQDTSMLTNQLNLTSLVQNYEMYTALLGSLIIDGPTGFDIGLPPEWMAAKAWEDLLANITAQFNENVKFLEENSMQLLTSTLTNQMLTQWLSDLETELPTEMKSLHLAVAVMDAVLKELEGYVGKNVSLEVIFQGYPETTKIVQQLPNLPVLLEVLMKNNFQLPAWWYADMARTCADPIALFDVVPAHLETVYRNSIDSLCSVNYTKVQLEMQDLLNINMDNLQATGSLNFMELTSLIEKMVDVIPKLSATTRWTQDYSWLYDYDWNRMLKDQENTDTAKILQQIGDSTLADTLQQMLLANLSGDGMNQILLKTQIALELIISSLKPLMTTNITLELIFKDSPAMLNIIEHMDKVPVIAEVVIKTLINKSAKLSAWATGNVSEVCYGKQDEIFDIPAHLKSQFEEILGVLCKTDYNQLSGELASIVKVPEFTIIVKEVIPGMANMSLLLEDFTFLAGMLSELSSKSLIWSTDFSPLINWKWKSIFENITSFTEWDDWKNLLPDVFMSLNTSLAGVFPQWLSVIDGMAQVMENIAIMNDPELLYKDTVEHKKLFDISMKMHEIMEMLILSSLNQEKFGPVQQILSSEPWKVCGLSNLDDFVVLPPNASFTATWLKEQLCSLNTTVLEAELDIIQQRLYGPLLNLFLGHPMPSSNMTATLQRIANVQKLWTKAFTVNATSTFTLLDFPIFDQTTWEKSIERISNNIMTMSPMSTDFSSYMKSLETLSSIYNLPEVNKQLHMNEAIMDVLIMKLSALINVTELRLPDLFAGSPNLMKLAELAENTPELMDVMAKSFFTKPFQDLLKDNMTVALFKVCYPGSFLSDFLVIPANTSVNWAEVKSQFCAVNLTALEDEITKYAGVQHILAQGNNESPVNYTGLYLRQMKLQSLIEQLILRPPQFKSKGSLLNPDAWLSALGNVMNELQNTDQTVKLLQPLSMLLNNTGAGQTMDIVIAELVKAVNDYLRGLSRTGPITLEDLLHGAPELTRMVTSALNLADDVIEMLLHVPLKSPQAAQDYFMQLSTAKDPLQFVCNHTAKDIVKWFDLPDTVDVEQLLSVPCKVNDTLLTKELMDLLRINSLISRLGEYSETGATNVNWTQVLLNYNELNVQFNQLLSDLSRFQVPEIDQDRINQLVENFLKNVDVGTDWNIILPVFEPILTALIAYDVWPSTWNGYVEVTRVFTDYISDIIDSLDIQNPTLDFGKLFVNTTEWKKTLEAYLDISPQLVNVLFESTARPEKLAEIASLDLAEMTEILCNPSMLKEYFVFPQYFNVSAVTDILCRLNTSALAEEFMSQFKIENLGKQLNQALGSTSRLDPQALFASVNKLVKNIEKLMNITSVNFLERDIASLFNMSMGSVGPIPAIWDTLKGIPNKLTSYDTVGMAKTLDKLDDMLQGTAFWTTYKQILVGANLFMEVALKNINELPPGSDVTLGHLLKNEPVTRRFLQQTMNWTPQLVNVLMSQYIDFAKLIQAETEADIKALFCGPDVKYRTTEDRQAIKEVVCESNFTAILEELKRQWNWEYINKQLQEVASNMTLTSLNYTRYLMNAQKLADQYMMYFSNITLPTVPQFMMYEGNYTAWLTKMNRAFTNPDTTDSDTLKLLADWLEAQSQDPATAVVWNFIVPTLSAVNMVAKALNDRLKNLPVNLTLADILKDEEYIQNYLNLVFANFPEIANTTLYMPTDVDTLLALLENQDSLLDVTKLLCAGMINPAARDILCHPNVTRLEMDAKNIINWDHIIAEISKINTNQSISNFNWTEYLQNLADLQTNFGAVLQTQPSLDQFFAYKGNVTAWMEKLKGLENINIMEYINMLQHVAFEGLKYMGPTFENKETNQLFSIASVLFDWMTGVLEQIVQDGKITLGNLIGDSKLLNDILSSSLKIDRYVDALLSSTLDPSLVSQLAMGDVAQVQEALCGQPLDRIIHLSPESNISLAELQTLLCSTNLTSLVTELQSIFSVQKLIDLITYPHGAQSSFREALEKGLKFSDLLNKLIAKQPELDLSTPNMFNDFGETLNGILDQFLQQGIQDQLMAAMRSLIKSDIFDSPGLSNTMITLNTVMSRMTDIMDKLKADGFTFESLLSNSSAMSTFYKDLMLSYPEIMSQLQADMATIPLLESLSSNPDVVKAVCNLTVYSDVLKVPMYINISAVREALCGRPGKDWYNNLVDAGLDADFITFLATVINYKYTHGPVTLPTPGFSREDFLKNVDTLIKLMQQLEVLEIFGLNMNSSSWIKLFTAMAEGANEATLQTVIQQLKSLDYTLTAFPGLSEFPLKEYVYAAALTLEYLNQQIQNVKDTNGQINLGSLLPDMAATTKALEGLLSPETINQILAAAINPEMLVHLSDPKKFEATVCDKKLFEDTFNFTVNVDLDQLQEEICAVAKNSSFLIQQLLTTFDYIAYMNAMQAVLNKGIVPRDPWELISSQLDTFIKNIEAFSSLENSTLGLEKLLANLNSLLGGVQTPTVNYGASCQAITSLLDGITPNNELRRYLSDAQLYMELTIKAIEAVPDVHPILCAMPNQNLTQLYNSFSQSNIMDFVKEIGKIISAETTAPNFNCSVYLSLEEKISGTFIETLYKWPAIFNETVHCVAKSVDQKLPSLAEIDGIIRQLRDIKSLVDNIPDLSTTGDISAIMDLIIEGIVQQKPLLMTIENMMTNNSNLVQYLSSIGNISTAVVQELFKSSVNVDLEHFLNMSDSDIAKVLCNPEDLSKLIQVSPNLYVWGLDARNISSWLCGPKLNETVKQLKESINVGNMFLKVVSQVPQYGLDTDWFTQVMKSIDVLINDLGSVVQLSSVISGLDLQELIKFLPELQRFLETDGPDKVFEDLQVLLEHLKAGVSDPTGRAIIDDLMVLANGIKSLSILQDYIPRAVVLGDLVKDAADFKRFLMSMNISSEVADSILNSSIPFNVMLNVSAMDISGMMCEPDQFKKLLILPETASVNASHISRVLCGLGDPAIVNITEYISRQVNIGNLIKELVSFDPEVILSKSNISKEELKEMMNGFRPIGGNVQEMLTNLQNITSVIDLTSIIEAQTGSGTVGALSELVCGRKEAFYVEDSLNLNTDNEEVVEDNVDSLTRRKRAINNERQNEIDQLEMAILKTPFCQDIYMDLVKSENGRVIWAYIKPLLVGKIPFAPDNAMTRMIMKESVSIFKGINSLQELAQTMTDNIENLAEFGKVNVDMDSLKKALENSFVSGSIRELLGMEGKELLSQLEAMQGLTQENIKHIKALASLAANFTKCVSTNRLEAYSTEKALENRAKDLSRYNQVLAAVVFEMEESTSARERSGSSVSPTAGPSPLPKHIKYTIRMDIDNVPTTKLLKHFWWKPAPDSKNFASDQRYLRGFLELQDMIERAIIKVQTGADAPLPSVAIQQFPQPCYSDDTFQHYVSAYFMPIVMMLGWLVVFANSIRIIVYDKEKGLEVHMKIMGLRCGINWLGWFIMTFVGMIILSVITSLFVRLGNLFGKTDFFVILVIFICFSFSNTMMAYMISVFFTRTTLAAFTGVMVYLISYLPFVFVVAIGAEISFQVSAVVSISSTTAFSLASQILSYAEQRGTGGQWSNLEDLAFRNDWSLVWCIYMMVIDGVGYGIIGWYVSTVFPGKFGMPQPWYFPVSPSYWGCRSNNPYKKTKYKFTQYGNPILADEEPGIKMAAFRSLDPAKKDDALNPPFTSAQEHKIGPGEKDPDMPVGISVHKLKKVYKGRKKTAVQDLSVNFYKGQVTAFLGRNGAGKTTTINMLSGVFPPSSGIAFINGRSILDDFGNIRKQLGICPQHEILFDYMTVKEHLEFYSSLKSKQSKAEQIEELENMLGITGLQDSWNVKAKQLSGGQKRRLSVALAFIGGSDIIILDEPTSGVDPAARRSIWDLITSHREGRTILLSTHHLDEADIIGDRIAIIHQGKLVCSGSPIYLKSEYGSGYQLTLAENSTNVAASWNTDELLSLVTQHIPNARMVEEMGREVTIVLPTTNGQLGKFKDLFVDLERRKEELNVGSFGISDTTLEEVFLKLVVYVEKGKPINSKSLRAWNLKADFDIDSLLDDSRVDTDPKSGSESHGVNGLANGLQTDSLSGRSKATGISLKWRQFWAVMAKRFHHHRRDFRSFLSQIILPVVFMILAMACTLAKPNANDMPLLILSPALYGPNTNMFYRMEQPYNEHNVDFIDTVFHKPGLGTTCMEGSEMEYRCYDKAGEWETETIPSDKYNMYNNPEECVCENGWQNCPEGSGGMPKPHQRTLDGNHLYNITGSTFTTAKYLARTYEDFEFNRNRYGGWEFEPEKNSSKVTVWYNNKGYHVLPSYYNALNNMVLRSNLDNMGYNDSDEYGITVYSHPLSLTKEQLSENTFMQSLADTGIALTILCAFCFVPAGYVIYLINERVHNEKRMQHISGVGIFMYWGAAIIWDMLSFLLTIGLATAVAAAFQISIYNERMNLPAFVVLLVLFGWASIPLMYIISRAFKEATTGYMMIFIGNLLVGINTTACVFLLQFFSYNPEVEKAKEILEQLFLIFPQFCLGNGLVKLSSNQLTADVYKRFNIDRYQNPFSFEMLGWNLVALAIQGLVFLILNLIIEARPCESSSAYGKRRVVDHKEDSDVSLERQRVVTGEANNDLLQLHNLRKKYRRGMKKVVAVENLSVGVSRGECFGLLGVNGAGKTTTFNMITGTTIPNSGVAVFDSNVISVNDADMGQNLGYCPQEDALDRFVTVKETLNIYGKIKGIPSSDLNQVVETAIMKFGLERFTNKSVKHLSGGTKRKLSTALALLGDPDLVLMDEPTSGMDPQSRRVVWNNLIKVIKQNKAVVITSHSMSECDAVCTKMAVMVNGRFMCLGSGQHLKNKFGQGYTVTIRVLGKKYDISEVISYVRSSFHGAFVTDQHINVVDFEIPMQSASLSEIFGKLEQEKVTGNLNILEYSVAQTTLDHVFIKFAKRQTDGLEEDGDEDVEIGHNHYGSLERLKGTPGSRSLHSSDSMGSFKVMRPKEVTRSMRSVEKGFVNASYDKAGDTPEPAASVVSQGDMPADCTEETPGTTHEEALTAPKPDPQPVSVISIGDQSDSSMPDGSQFVSVIPVGNQSGSATQDGSKLVSVIPVDTSQEPRQVSKITVEVDEDTSDRSQPPPPSDVSYVTSVHIGGYTPSLPESSTHEVYPTTIEDPSGAFHPTPIGEPHSYDSVDIRM